MAMADLRPDARRLVRVGGAALSLAFLAFALHAAVGFGGTSSDTFFESWVYDGLMLGAAASCFARALLVERERSAWAVIGLGLAVWTSGEIYYSLAFSAGQVVPIPSLADAGYLAFYPIAYVGLIMLLRARVGAFSAAQWLDGLIVGSAVAAVAAATALGPIVAASTTGSALAVATNLAYPIADLTLLTLVVTASAFTGWRPGRSWITLGGGLVVLALSDGLYLLQSAQGTYLEGGLLDAAWPLGALLLAAAAWLAPGPRRVAAPRGLRVAFIPAAAALIAIALQLSDRFVHISGLAEVLSLITLLCVVIRMTLSHRDNQAVLQSSIREAHSDALTGLGNRRRLMSDLDLAAALPPAPGKLRLLILFDLNGFKAYNDAFGHPAGDTLLARLGSRLDAFAGPQGAAYRLGGDEFCLLAETSAAAVDGLVAGAGAALSERGDGFVITASRGSVLLPSEASSAEDALQLADRRMYADKSRDRASAGAQSRDVLMSALRERQPELHAHLADVAELAARVAGELRMGAEQRDELVRAAELHDTGKMAIPDAILNKPGALDDQEWEFMHKHPLIGERIIAAAPALGPVARLVRASHERWDGHGYPDGLSGEQIPLGSRVVAVCDAYEAMVAGRPYSEPVSQGEALEELARCAGTQFDPEVVSAFSATVQRRSSANVR
jgi:two-component system, cell cycle response regulator